MSLVISCPECDKKYRVDEKFLGRKIACKSCGSAIEISADAAPPAPGKKPADDDETPAAAPKSKKRSRDLDEDERNEDEPPRRSNKSRTAKKSSSSKTNKFIGTQLGGQLAGAAGALLFTLAVGLMVYSNSAANTANRAKESADFQEQMQKLNGPEAQFERAIDQLKAGKDEGSAYNVLRSQSVREERREEVASYLERGLEGRYAYDAAFLLAKWGGKENVPALVRKLEAITASPNNGDSPTRVNLIKALGSTKDPSVVKPLLAHFKSLPADQKPISEALRPFGPAAESGLLDLLGDPNPAVRSAATIALREMGSAEPNAEQNFNRFYAQLKQNANPEDRKKALNWFSFLSPNKSLNATKRKDTAILLDDALRSEDDRLLAIRAIIRWGTTDNTPTLLEQLDTTDAAFRLLVIEALGEIKDAASIKPLVDRMLVETPGAVTVGKNQPITLSDVIIKIGPIAENEILRLLDNPGTAIRLKGINVLKIIGTAKSIPAIEKVMAQAAATGKAKTPILVREGGNAIALINSRTK